MKHPEWIGRYRVDDIIGIGAAGLVYLARDPLIDRNVAVKMLRGDLGQRSAHELRMRFLREARAAGRLSHPNIVTVYDVGEDGAFEDAFIAMEYLEGTTLKDVISWMRWLGRICRPAGRKPRAPPAIRSRSLAWMPEMRVGASFPWRPSTLWRPVRFRKAVGFATHPLVLWRGDFRIPWTGQPRDGGSGEFVRKTLFVPEGVHAIEVHITSEPHGVDVRGTIEGEFDAGMLRRLEVSLDSQSSALALAWLD